MIMWKGGLQKRKGYQDLNWNDFVILFPRNHNIYVFDLGLARHATMPIKTRNDEME
jgi:hypothetical protein